jgi:hypothetical protein
MLAAAASFTLVGPLGLPWWLPIVVLGFFGLASAGLRRLALNKGRELWRGLAVLRRLGDGSRVIGFVLIAVFAQVARNWLLLHAVGVLLTATGTLGGLCFAAWAGVDHLWGAAARRRKSRRAALAPRRPTVTPARDSGPL